VEEFENIAEYYLRRGRTKDSSKAVEFGMKLHPGSTVLKAKRAKIYLAMGEISKAYQLLSTLSEADYETVLLKIEALVRMERYGEAQKLVNSLTADNSGDLDNILLDIAYIYLEHDNFEEAAQYLLKGFQINPRNIDLLFELAFCYEQLEENEKAIQIYNRILDLDPFSGEAWFNLGQIYYTLQVFQKAIEAYEFVLAVDPTDTLALLQKAHAHFQLDQFQKAIENKLNTRNYQRPCFNHFIHC
jgi:tetratricopeptide (TPR) repeat protein